MTERTDEEMDRLTVDFKEGFPCPQVNCTGTFQFPPVEGCTCHISPPCNTCLDKQLTCTECHYAIPN